MIRLAAVIETFETDFLAQYRDQLTPDHDRALAAMKHCRTQASPMMQVKCTECEHQKRVPHSCGHRHCLHCQHHESQPWLERQLKKQVPAESFLLTFTLPAEFRALSWAHQNVVYDLLMSGSWETVRTFSQNDPQLQGTPGAIAVRHTNTRRLDDPLALTRIDPFVLTRTDPLPGLKRNGSRWRSVFLVGYPER